MLQTFVVGGVSRGTGGSTVVRLDETMTGSIVSTPAAVVVCGAVLLLAGDPLGRGLITLAVGMYIGEEEK